MVHQKIRLSKIDIWIHPRSLIARPLKMMVGFDEFPFGARPIFRGKLTVKLPGSIPFGKPSFLGSMLNLGNVSGWNPGHLFIVFF